MFVLMAYDVEVKRLPKALEMGRKHPKPYERRREDPAERPKRKPWRRPLPPVKLRKPR